MFLIRQSEAERMAIKFHYLSPVEAKLDWARPRQLKLSGKSVRTFLLLVLWAFCIHICAEYIYLKKVKPLLYRARIPWNLWWTFYWYTHVRLFRILLVIPNNLEPNLLPCVRNIIRRLSLKLYLPIVYNRPFLPIQRQTCELFELLSGHNFSCSSCANSARGNSFVPALQIPGLENCVIITHF